MSARPELWLDEEARHRMTTNAQAALIIACVLVGLVVVLLW